MSIDSIAVLRRAEVYRLLALCLDRPTQNTKETIKDIGNGIQKNIGEPINGDVLDCLNEVLLQVEQVPVSVWESEHNRMFVNEVFVPPSEGSYCLSERGAVVGDICGFYKAFHTQAVDQVGPPDQMKIELGFMCILAMKEANAIHMLPDKIEITRSAEKAFFEDHLGRWSSLFSARLSNCSSLSVYRALARLLLVWFKCECTYWNVVPTAYPETITPLEEGQVQCPFSNDCLQ